MRFSKTSAAAVAASIPLATAQTYTTCNPTEKSCPADTGLTASTFHSDFTQGSGSMTSWTQADGTKLNFGANGAEYTISGQGQAPTVSSDFYIFFGRIDVTMKAAPGTGIVSSIVLESDDLDEIDWEFLGGNTAQVETNFFGKGNTTTYNRAIYYSVATPQDTFHTYTIDWNQERLEFIIDGATVRTIPYTDPIALGGKNYPQTPMRLKLGNWAGGGPGEPQGTVQWAGGNTDFSQGPFTMYVQSVNIQNYNPASSYEWTDTSGSWQSIKAVGGSSSGGASSASASETSTSSATGSSTGSASGSSSTGSVSKKSSAATTAPTSSISVAPLSLGVGVVASVTSTGSSYSMNTQSASALNNNATGTGSSPTPTATPSSTQIPGSSGSTTQIMAGSSLLSLALAFLLL